MPVTPKFGTSMQEEHELERPAWTTGRLTQNEENLRSLPDSSTLAPPHIETKANTQSLE